jgi:hypothetical protein
MPLRPMFQPDSTPFRKRRLARGNDEARTATVPAPSLLLHDVPRAEASDQGKVFRRARAQDLRAPANLDLLRSMTVIRDAFHTSDKSSYTQSLP